MEVQPAHPAHTTNLTNPSNLCAVIDDYVNYHCTIQSQGPSLSLIVMKSECHLFFNPQDSGKPPCPTKPTWLVAIPQ